MNYKTRSCELRLSFAFFCEQQLGYLEGTMLNCPQAPGRTNVGPPEAPHSQIRNRVEECQAVNRLSCSLAAAP